MSVLIKNSATQEGWNRRSWLFDAFLASFLLLLVGIYSWGRLFGFHGDIISLLALVFFVFGVSTLLTSFGKPDKTTPWFVCIPVLFLVVALGYIEMTSSERVDAVLQSIDRGECSELDDRGSARLACNEVEKIRQDIVGGILVVREQEQKYLNSTDCKYSVGRPSNGNLNYLIEHSCSGVAVGNRVSIIATPIFDDSQYEFSYKLSFSVVKEG